MHAPSPPVALLDMLPQGGAIQEVCETRVPMGASLRDLLANRIRDDGEQDHWLCATLAWVEARLTGADEVVAAVIDRQGVRQGAVAVTGHRDAAALRAAVIATLAPDGPLAQPAWAVAMAGAAVPECGLQATSVWSLHADRGELVVRHREPMGVDAVHLLADCVQRALAGLLGDGSLDALDLVDADTRHGQLIEWNRTAVVRTGPITVHGRFERMREATPGSVAVVDGRQSLTYDELGRRADALALQLRAAGVVPGDVVAVMLPRSAEVVVAVLGILKAGAAYLPIDPTHPAQRLQFVLQDAGADVAVVAAHDANLPSTIHQLAMAAGTDAAMPAIQPENENGGDALAYVMYTSGSTGEPKGVEILHHSILRLVCEVDYIATGPDMRMLHAAPLGFDASTLELWAPLLSGGTVVVHDEIMPTAAGLASTIERHGVTTAWLTAALFNAIVDTDPQHLAGLCELFTGGEALSVDHVRRLRRAVPALRLRNGYGPTECTTFTCTHPIDEVADDCTAIPLGRPIADTRVYILNARRQPIPVGMVGELYVGGAGLARGYLHRPELTRERFVPDPFVPGERLYRTGDLVRYRADGVIEFIGRADTQVKIRGFRIEPGEIEAVLARHPGVVSCAVVALADAASNKRLVAYFVATGDSVAAPALRAHVAAALPEFMVPARYVRIAALPLTANGKLDRAALPLPDRSRPELANGYEPAVGAEEARICDAFGVLLDIERIGRHDNFFELGGNSLLALRMLERLHDHGAGKVAATTLFAHPTPAGLAAALKRGGAQALAPARIARPRHDAAHEPIAIVAMATRLPGADNVEAFWRNLCEGRDSITCFAADELDPAVPRAERDDPAYVPSRGVIEGVELFDAAFFGISPREAELMDPQQRIFLELCWECLERGGHAPDATPGPVGVFAGMYNATYFQRHVAAHPELVARLGAFQVMLGNEKDYIATRVAHKLNLTGPAVSIHTACSTSLVAICQAMASLQAGGCDMALAGGIAVTCPPRSGYLYQEGTMLSSDGHTRSFDKAAQGTVFSDGAAVVLLKRLPDAIADGNTVYAVLRGGAINNDGGHKASFTAPSSDGQAAVIAQAQADAGVDPRSIGYVETHGTATPLGDPIEIEGLTRAFRLQTADTGFCRIGSVKSNIGHTVMAAGAAGVIKTALALHEGRIPGTAHFSEPNPEIDFAGSPFTVHGGLVEWARGDAPRRAGVSSFGVGGTNAHVVMEEAPACAPGEAGSGPQLLALSARTPAALREAMIRLADHLEMQPRQDLADVAWTLAVGRTAFAHRMVVVAGDAAGAVAALRDADAQANAARTRAARQREVVFMFPGQGATYAGMGRALHAAEPAFRAAFDECVALLQPVLGDDLRALMFSDDPQALLPTAIMQPATFVIEYALARWWMSLGIQPAAMIGHSVGEFVAATLAGVFTLGDALRLVATRGALMQAQPPGAMLSLRLSADTLLARMPEGLSLAAENAPGACVVAGPTPLVAAFQARLEGEGIACRMLATSHAFHSSMMEPVVAPFLAQLAATPMREPTIPLVSTASGDWLGVADATSPGYWARHLREPVRFAAAIGRVLDDTSRLLLEVGPRATLGGLARQHPAQRKHDVPAIASLADQPEREWASVRLAAGQLWAQGVAFDPAQFDRRAARRRVRLPTYPFERQRHWLDAAPAIAGEVPSAPSTHPIL
ncbi:MAG: amino acid adenylation domain-containing protein, partial [Lysobacteraceae bacterium]